MRKYVFGEQLWQQKDLRTYGYIIPYDHADRARLHHLITDMIHRCCNQKDRYYHLYGGRGIGIDPDWMDPIAGKANRKNFYRWCIDNGWRKGLQLDRIDNSKGYGPDNCRFVEPRVNCRNRRSNRMMTFRGETKSMAEWAERLGISYKAIAHRVNRGMSDEEALTRVVTHGNEHLFSFNGRTMNIKQWAEKTGVPKWLIARRLKRGMTFKQAITTPVDWKPIKLHTMARRTD